MVNFILIGHTDRTHLVKAMERSKIFFESVKKLIANMARQRQPVVIKETDIVEIHTKGSGPGGQSVNKSSNAVILLHKPTGIQVKSHKTRYMEINRRDAQKILTEKLDVLINGPSSKPSLEAARERERKRVKARKSKMKHQQPLDNKPTNC